MARHYSADHRAAYRARQTAERERTAARRAARVRKVYERTVTA